MKEPIFNYHTHTYRCGHASDAKDEEYVVAAINLGLKRLGFSDHIPPMPGIVHNPIGRMAPNQKDDYLNSIKNLKEKYIDEIEIIVGWEAEYDERLLPFLLTSKNEVDFMILGAHSTHSGMKIFERGKPLEYAKNICDAIKSGLYDIVAHPDTFMLQRDKAEDETKFLEEAKEASLLICKTAKAYNVPLEINFNGILNSRGKTYPDGELGYPHSLFWNTAKEVGTLVILGIDAHSPCRFDAFYDSLALINKTINLKDLNFVDDNYQSVIARSNNHKLREALTNIRNNVFSKESP